MIKKNCHANHLGISPGILKQYESGEMNGTQQEPKIKNLIERYNAARIKRSYKESMIKMQEQLEINQAELAMLFGISLSALKKVFAEENVSRERRAIVRSYIDNIPIYEALILEELDDLSYVRGDNEREQQ